MRHWTWKGREVACPRAIVDYVLDSHSAARNHEIQLGNTIRLGEFKALVLTIGEFQLERISLALIPPTRADGERPTGQESWNPAQDLL